MAESPNVLDFLIQQVGSGRVSLTGDSMNPLIRHGMIAEITPLNGAERPGEILLYRGTAGLVAHRLIKIDGTKFVLCGDAYPRNLELIDQADIIGRVRKIWTGPELGSRRVDGIVFGMLGAIIRIARPARAFQSTLGDWLHFAFQPPVARRGFGILVRACLAFERGEWELGVALVESIPHQVLLDIAGAHGLTGFLYRWGVDARAAGFPFRNDLWKSLREIRWATDLLADRTRFVAQDAIGKLADGGVEAIVLKGGWRLLSGVKDAATHLSMDVDLLVERKSIDRALQLLKLGGYRFDSGARSLETYDKFHHHKAPLWFGNYATPVELHVALTRPGTTSATLDYLNLAPYFERFATAELVVLGLNRSASALHLAYHARDLKRFRDVVLLAQSMREMSACDRTEFDRLVAAERKDRIRLRSVVSLARAFDGKQITERDLRRYLSWAIAREDLPAPLLRRVGILESLFARNGFYWRNARFAVGQLRRLVFDLIALPIAFRWLRVGEAANPQHLDALFDGIN